MSKEDERHDITVEQYIASLDDAVLVADAKKLAEIMQRISGQEPILYGFGTIGYGVYKYEYTSGRKGEAHTIAFYPRKGKITVYLMDGTMRYTKELQKLGKHTLIGYCIYIKRLSDIDLNVLEGILKESYEFIEKEASAGPINRILWQTEK
jgi:hypothetical protein